MKLVIFFLFYNNLFIYQVLCTLIYRRRSLYSFWLNLPTDVSKMTLFWPLRTSITDEMCKTPTTCVWSGHTLVLCTLTIFAVCAARVVDNYGSQIQNRQSLHHGFHYFSCQEYILAVCAMNCMVIHTGYLSTCCLTVAVIKSTHTVLFYLGVIFLMHRQRLRLCPMATLLHVPWLTMESDYMFLYHIQLR